MIQNNNYLPIQIESNLKNIKINNSVKTSSNDNGQRSDLATQIDNKEQPRQNEKYIYKTKSNVQQRQQKSQCTYKKYNDETKKQANSRQFLTLYKQGDQIAYSKENRNQKPEDSLKVKSQETSVYNYNNQCGQQSKDTVDDVYQQTSRIVMTKSEYSTFQINAHLKQKLLSICLNSIETEIDTFGRQSQLIQIPFIIQKAQALFIVHHLFNQTDFVKQDFLITFQSEDMANMRNVYGDDIEIFKLEIVPTQEQLDSIRNIELTIFNQMKETSYSQEVLTFQSVIQSNGNLLLFLSLDVIQQYYCELNTLKQQHCDKNQIHSILHYKDQNPLTLPFETTLDRGREESQKAERSSLVPCSPITVQMTQQTSGSSISQVPVSKLFCPQATQQILQKVKKIKIQENLNNVLDVIRFIVSIVPSKLLITPEYIDIRQKSHQSIVQSRFWITSIIQNNQS